MKKKGFVAVILIIVMSMLQTMLVFGDNESTVLIESKKIKAQETQVQTSCSVSGDLQATNGKFRITYNPQELVLKEASTGDALSSAMVQINDPINGNKSEGEIVFVFASAQSINLNRSLLNLVFEKGSDFQKDTQAVVQVKVEELDNDGTALTAGTQDGTITIEDENGNNGDNNNSGKDDNSDNNNSDNNNSSNNFSDNNNNSNHNASNSNGSNSSTQNKNQNTQGSSNQQGAQKNNTQTAKKTTESKSSTASNAKTGDTTKIAPALAAGAVSLIVIAVIVLGLRKRRDK